MPSDPKAFGGHHLPRLTLPSLKLLAQTLNGLPR